MLELRGVDQTADDGNGKPETAANNQLGRWGRVNFSN